MSESVALLIPVYNGADTLGDVIRRCKALDMPVLIVDDGSTDGSAQVAREAGADMIQSHPVNRGKGAALKTGLNFSRGKDFEAVISLDADGQHVPDEAVKFVQRYREGFRGILVGNRFEDEEYLQRMPALRAVSNRVSSDLIRWLAAVPIQDIQCGFRLYRLDAIQSLNSHCDGFEFETEILLQAASSGLPLGNVPIRCEYPEGTVHSRYRPVSDSWKVAKIVIDHLWRSRRNRRCPKPEKT